MLDVDDPLHELGGLGLGRAGGRQGNHLSRCELAKRRDSRLPIGRSVQRCNGVTLDPQRTGGVTWLRANESLQEQRHG